MRSLILASLLGLVTAQSGSVDSVIASASTPSVPSLAPSPASSSQPNAPVVTPSPSISAPSTGSSTAVTVAADGSGQFTAINAAIAFAQNAPNGGIPTVTILPGTYTDAVTVLGTQTVTLAGPTGAADWSKNQVTVSTAGAAFSIGTDKSKGVTVRNINFVSSATTVLSLRGANLGFYGCSVVSPGAGAITSSFGIAFFANSYIEGADKLFVNVPAIYVYGSTIAPAPGSQNLIYNKGASSSTGTFYNSTVVIDSSNIRQKAGASNTGVNLAAPNAAGAVAIFRGTYMSNVISGAGIHPLAATISSYYGEFQNTGPGSYASNAKSRSVYDNLLSVELVSQFTIDKVFGNAAAPYGSSSLSWLDQDVLADLRASNAAQLAAAPIPVVSSSASVASSSSSSSSSSPSSSAASSSPIFSTVSSSSDVSGTSTSSAVSSGSSSASISAFASSAPASASISGSDSVSSVVSVPLTSSSTVSASAASSSDMSSVASVSSDSGSVVSMSSTASTSGTATISATVSSSSAAVSCSPPVQSSTLVVSKTPGPCEYANITAAVNALPKDNKPYTIAIGAGTYVEQLNINRNGKVTLIGATSFTNDYTQNQVRIEFAKGFLTNLGRNEETPVLYAKKANDNSGFAVYNIDFINTYPQTYNTAALAADFYGNNMAAYGCSFIGFQDTLLANKGTQVFSNCYIEGSVDFVWGFSTAYFHQCKLVTNTPGTCIAAQSRATADAPGGYVFDSCMVTYSSGYGNTFGTSFLGRPYSQFSIAVYLNSYIDKHISTAGWSIWSTGSPQTSGVMFGEFNNTGPGSWQASSKRANFATNLTPDQASKYSLSAWIGDTSWLDMAAYNAIPSYSVTGPSGTTPLPPTNTTMPSTNTTMPTPPASTATINAHPDSGTVPPLGAVIVSNDASRNGSYTSITAALASLPNDNTNQTIFIYPGSYNEQIPGINRSGAVRIIGYTSGNPGQSFKDNQVTITFARGLSVSPLPAGRSNAETAVVATASSRISFYNINMINTDNLDGAIPSYVTLAASIYGNDIAFYGCSFDGWQDTLLTGATTGYQYYESCYIGGAIDFIWGYSKAYFKGCTLGAKRKNSAITAHSRSSSSAIGGYIFDQCLFTSAPGAIDDLTQAVYLGRPYSQYALVVVKNSYLDGTIQPAGWKVWSANDPRTGAVTFAEFNNSGPSNWENNAAARQAFGYATLLTSDTYSLGSVMDSTEWIDQTYWSSITTPQPTVPIVVPPANTTTPGNSTFDGTKPPTGALIVSKSPIDGVTTYTTIQEALNAAPVSSRSNATIFIYPGVYEEQLIITKSGHTIFQGYSSSTDDYSKNQVTIQFSRGIDTQGTEGSNTDGATVYVKGNFFHAYNINFRNNFGTQQDMASLGFAVQSSKFAGLYACQVYGNQDTLSISGYLFAFKSYIEGNIDFIYGSGSGYFLDSTISPNEDGISITASKRATSTTSAGFVFDQCQLKPAAGAGSFKNVALGRPWNNFSRVAYIGCYMDSMISAAGWNQWSKSTPNTDGVVYGEYRNYGPGANMCKRVTFSQQLSDTDVVQFQLWNFFPSTSFIDFSRVDTSPFSVGMGSAQTCTAISSTISAASSTMSSSAMVSSSAVVSSSIPVVTAYTTSTLIQKLTTNTVITAPDVTSTSILKLTETIVLTGLDVTSTGTLKVTSMTTVTSPDVTSTATSVVTQDVGLTVTPVPITKNSLLIETVIVRAVVTKAAATQTMKTTSTLVQLSTTVPKPTTITRSEGTTVFTTLSIFPKGASTTVRTTTSIKPSITKTVTIQPKNTVTVETISTKTINKKTTRTLQCIPTKPAQRMFRRGAVLPHALASTTTVTLTETTTTFVKTLTTTQSGLTALTTQTVVAATKTNTVKGQTILTTLTSVAKTATIAQPGATHFTTLTSTSSIGKTTTLKPSTTLLFSTSTETSTQLSTLTAQAVTTTSTLLTTATQVVQGAQQTVTIVRSSDVTSEVRTTMPVVTVTKYETVTEGSGVTTQSVDGLVKTRTVTLKASTTVWTEVTKTAKGAKSCTD